MIKHTIIYPMMRYMNIPTHEHTISSTWSIFDVLQFDADNRIERNTWEVLNEHVFKYVWIPLAYSNNLSSIMWKKKDHEISFVVTWSWFDMCLLFNTETKVIEIIDIINTNPLFKVYLIRYNLSQTHKEKFDKIITTWIRSGKHINGYSYSPKIWRAEVDTEKENIIDTIQWVLKQNILDETWLEKELQNICELYKKWYFDQKSILLSVYALPQWEAFWKEHWVSTSFYLHLHDQADESYIHFSTYIRKKQQE